MTPEARAPNRPRIAVIEEAADQIYSLRFILESLGYEVVAPPVRPDLMVKLYGLRPTVVLVDMLMPESVGLKVLEGLKRAEIPGIRVLALTADAVPLSEDEILAAGAHDVLSKPYNVSELQAKLQV